MDFEEMAHDARRALERERDELVERVGELNMRLQMLDDIDSLVKENCQLKEENGELQQQLDDEKQQKAELEMKLVEMSKLTAGVAKKSTEESLLKALRTYVNRSKRKTADKRAFAKTATLEIANANNLDLPEDLRTAIDSLDDEQTVESKVITATTYNDIHDNGSVNLNDKE